LTREIIIVLLLTEPGTAPRNVQVRPLSSSTMVIQWDEPETPNGQVTVSCRSVFSHLSFFRFFLHAISFTVLVKSLRLKYCYVQTLVMNYMFELSGM